MTLSDILKRPTVAQALKDKEAIKVEAYSGSTTSDFYFASLVNKLKPNQVLYISHYAPKNWLRVLHKSSVIKMKRYDSLEQAINEKVTATNLFINGLNKINMEDPCIGYDWQGIHHTTREYRVIPFTEIYEAEIILANQKEDKARAKPYIGNRGDLRIALEMALESGGHVDVIVPSVKKKEVEKYPFKISHFPLVRTKKDNPSCLWFNLTWNHTCREQEFYPLHYGRYDQEKRRKGDEIFADSHVIVGFKAGKETINRGDYGACVLDEDDPFFLLSSYGFNIMRKIMTQIVVEHGYGKNIEKKLLNKSDAGVWFVNQLKYDLDLNRKRGKINPGRLVYLKYFNPRNLNFAVYH
ncbi:MAG: hypothetical protein AABW45_01785 [Nanoarchaeota archaeon]